jgi:hypothetical protein
MLNEHVWVGQETDQPWMRGGGFLASFEHNGGTRILRRGYLSTDGIDPQAGKLLSGLFFITGA